MQARVRAEVEDLHRFFVDWFAGRAADTDDAFAAGFADRLDDAFTYVMPDGAVADRAAIVASLRRTHGSNPDFAIAISDVEVHAHRGPVVVASYIEWQTGARSFDRADSGRRSTAVLIDDGERLRWLRVHETWVPADALADNPLTA